MNYSVHYNMGYIEQEEEKPKNVRTKEDLRRTEEASKQASTQAISYTVLNLMTQCHPSADLRKYWPSP